MTRTQSAPASNVPDLDSAPVVVTIVSIGHFLSHLYQLAFPPLFPLIAADLDLSNTELGLLVSVVFVVMIILQTPLGSVVDTVGAKPVFVLGVFITGGGITLAGASVLLDGVVSVYGLLLIAAMISGVGQATFHPADYPLLDVVSDDTNQGKHFAVHMFAGFLGFAAAPLVVGGLGIGYGWEFALIAVGIVGILYAIVAQVLLHTVYLDRIKGRGEPVTDNPRPIGNQLVSDLRILMRPKILTVLVFFFIVSVGSIGISTFTVVYVIEGFGFSEFAGNTVLSAYMVLASVGILIGGVLADQFDVRRLIVVMMVLSTIFVAATIGGPVATPIVLVSLFGGIGLCYGMTIPARDRLVSLVTPPDAVGKGFGFVTTGMSIGGLVSPLLIGFAIDTLDVFVGFSIIVFAFFGSAIIVAAMRV